LSGRPEITRGLRLAAMILIVVWVVQLVYPRERAVPFASLAGEKFNFAKQETVRQSVVAMEQQTFSVQANETRLETSFAALGTDLDEQAAAGIVTNYAFAKRLVPFSIAWPQRLADIPSSHDNEKLGVFARKLADAANRQPQDATITRQGQDYIISKSKLGIVFETAETVSKLQSLKIPPKEVKLEGTPREPVFRSEDFERVVSQRDALLKRPLKLVIDDNEEPIPSDILASWTDVAANPGKKIVELVYNRPLMSEYLRSISNRFGTAPQPTTIRLVDGKEVGRTQGSAGRAVPAASSIEEIIKAIESKSAVVQLELKPVAPTEVYERIYTRSSAGLQLLIEEWQRAQSGATVGVAVRSLEGSTLAAGINVERPFFAASMYKLYLAQYVLRGFERATIDPNAAVGTTGKTTSQCVEAMIVQSDNACPEALIAKISSRTLNDFVQAEGFGSTAFLSDGTNGTAQDTAKFLERLYGGSLLNAASSKTLLGYMSRQIYRGALPAGSAPSGVADKVGFYGSVWHDAGIVYHPRGAYVLAVYTENASAAAIKDLAQRINDFMNR